MDKIQLNDKEFELFIPSEQLHEAIEHIASAIEADIEGKNPLFVGILNGAFMFISDLMHILNLPCELTFARYSSYKGTGSTGSLTEIIPLSVDVNGRSQFNGPTGDIMSSDSENHENGDHGRCEYKN